MPSYCTLVCGLAFAFLGAIVGAFIMTVADSIVSSGLFGYGRRKCVSDWASTSLQHVVAFLFMVM